MGSMGFMLADWSIATIRARRKKEKKLSKNKKDEGKELTLQTDGVSCEACGQLSVQLSYIEKQLDKIKLERLKWTQLLKTENVEDILVNVEAMVAETSKQKTSSTQLQIAQEKILKSLEEELKSKDIAHSEKVKSLEIIMAEEEKQLLQSTNMLRQQLADSRRGIQQLTKQLESKNTKMEDDDPRWQNEVESLQIVIDMKKEEVNQLKTSNNSLKLEMNRLVVIKTQLQVEKKCSEEISEVIKIKNDQLSQVVDKYEYIQHQLDIEMAAHLACQQELEKIHWEKDNFLNDQESVTSLIGSKNWKNVNNQKTGNRVKNSKM